MNAKNEEDYMTQKQAAVYLNIKEPSVADLRDTNQLPWKKIGSAVIIPRKAVVKLKIKRDKADVAKGKAFEVFGTIPCGPSATCEVYDTPEVIHIAKLLPPGEIRALRACGRSCSGWGILDKSLVFVRVQPDPEEGRFIVLQTPDGFTLKAYHGGKFYSFSAGGAPQAVDIGEATVWGVVIHVMSEPHFEMKAVLDRRNGTNNS